ncbi:hypothetical protein H7U12_04495 [Rufibacter sp. H-1]|uniref:Bacterial surface antigen (D15) domain-containing protein n=1 Tax=Rufibacter sediminis TaxID=2762756 RepID=A0ABR6VPZ6_9BACT|nr:hypothetical protein [Rufibacter sediminis]MBC3538928.1 hypothetical protein [Rufibacter sediminis]
MMHARLLLLFTMAGWFHCICAHAQVTPPTTSPNPAPFLQDTTNNKEFLQSLKRLSQKKTLFGRAVKALVIFKPRRVEGPIENTLLPVTNAQHNYKVVRSIYFKRLDAFGYSINDTLAMPDNSLERLGNALHMRSKRNLLRNQILFKEGDLLEPLDLSESERLLRQTDYLLDARVFVNDSTSTRDSVDIVIITKDVFSISASGSASTSSTRIGLRDLNFMGVGHQIRTNYRIGVSEPQPWQFLGSYFIQNISRSFISAELIYQNTHYYKQQSLSFRRDFYTTNTRYAGGASAGWYQTLQPDYYQQGEGEANPDQVIDHVPLHYNVQDFWLGRAFRLKSYDLAQDNAGSFIAAGRFMNISYTQGGGPTIQSARLYLTAFGYSFRKYYIDQYLFGFGRTEDIPAGTLLALTAGYEDGTLKNRLYFGLKGAFGKYQPNFGYLYGGIEYGSYRYLNSWEQGVLTSEALYFTPLYRLRNWRWRHFLWNRSSLGIRRPDLFALDIDQEDGIRGFSSGEVRGYRKFVLNYETNFFTPLTLLGFRLAIIGFADFAWLTSVANKSPLKEKPYTGFGLGLRFRNEFLPINTIQVLLGYYPRLPQTSSIQDFKLFQTTRQYYDFNDLRFTQPLISEFR